MKKLIILMILLGLAGVVYWLVSKDKLQNYYEDAESVVPQRSPVASDKYRLLIGNKFPSAQLVGGDGRVVSTADLLRSGKVVLFVDPGCNSCDGMVAKWIDLVDRHTVSAEEVVAICFMKPEDAESYRNQQRMNFRLFCDTARYFMNNHEVTDFPLQLVVGRSGTIHEHTYDVGRQIFPDQLNRWLQD